MYKSKASFWIRYRFLEQYELCRIQCKMKAQLFAGYNLEQPDWLRCTNYIEK